MTISVGWPAQWAAEFKGTEKGLHIEAGLEKTHMRLEPGESIRTPRMTIMSWISDQDRSINLWRRWFLAHVLPKSDGLPIKTMLVCAATDNGAEWTNANEKNQIQFMNEFKKRGMDYDLWWIDAGWYPCYNEKHEKFWPNTGTWIPDPEKFPNGFINISNNAKKNNAKFLLWFEPERVYELSQLNIEHHEFVLDLKSNDDEWMKENHLLNLGNPKCRKWITEHISKMIKDNGIETYRQDFNFPPLAYWQDNNDYDRQGMNENFHVQGYLQFWDDLLDQNPGLLIDSCASGGRRNDLETMHRSVPLHYTDYGYGDHPVKLAFNHTFYSWIPYFKEFTVSWDDCEKDEDKRYNKKVDSFSFHCGMAPMMFPNLDIRREDYDYKLAVKMISIWRKVADMMLHGDYYALTPFSTNNDKWVVRQFDVPETGKGMIQGIRLSECLDETIKVFPNVQDPDAIYTFANPETDETFEIQGNTLLHEGFLYKLPARNAAIWIYGIKARTTK